MDPPEAAGSDLSSDEAPVWRRPSRVTPTSTTPPDAIPKAVQRLASRSYWRLFGHIVASS
jgi:hypothetical protein